MEVDPEYRERVARARKARRHRNRFDESGASTPNESANGGLPNMIIQTDPTAPY